MKIIKSNFFIFLIVFFYVGSVYSCEFKNTSNNIFLNTSAMSVISGKTEVEYVCNLNKPYKIYPNINELKIYDNKENLEISYWLDPSFTEPLSISSPLLGIGSGEIEKKNIYIKITGMGPALNSLGNIVVNKHNLKIKHGLKIE